MFKFGKLRALFIKFIAALHLLVILNPALVHANILKENVLYILSDKEQIDYNDKNLQEILHGEYSNKYLIFKVYKAFIEWDSSNQSDNDIKTAKEILNQLDASYSKYISAFCKKDPEDAAEYIQNRFFCYLGSKRLLADTEEEFDEYSKLYNQFPLWLVLKYPQVLEYDHGRNPI